jgi:hypothetical protein
MMATGIPPHLVMSNGLTDVVKQTQLLKEEMRAELREVHAVEMLASAPTAPIDPSVDPRFQLWSWGGRLHMVPQGWVYPSTNIKDTWNLWHFGHLADKIRPLRCLKKFDLVGTAQITLQRRAV